MPQASWVLSSSSSISVCLRVRSCGAKRWAVWGRCAGLMPCFLPSSLAADANLCPVFRFGTLITSVAFHFSLPPSIPPQAFLGPRSGSVSIRGRRWPWLPIGLTKNLPMKLSVISLFSLFWFLFFIALVIFIMEIFD